MVESRIIYKFVNLRVFLANASVSTIFYLLPFSHKTDSYLQFQFYNVLFRYTSSCHLAKADKLIDQFKIWWKTYGRESNYLKIRKFKSIPSSCHYLKNWMPT